MIPFHFDAPPAQNSGTRVVFIHAGIENKEALFAFLAHAVPLPGYFGHNWDALDECLAEIGEHDAPKIALIHHDVPLHDTPANQRIYLEILADASRNSKSLGVFFPPNFHSHISSILE